jgi:glycosyltransferase involved in cell wall biosynthesis
MSRIKVNIIAGSGANSGPGSWIFSDMVNILVMGVDPLKFELNVTEQIDNSKLYDVYHYFHSTLAALNNCKMNHRALVTIHAMSDYQKNWSFEYKEKALLLANKVSAVSPGIIDTLISRGIDKDKIYYTPAGVDLENFTPTSIEDRELIEDHYNLKKYIIRFGIFSRRYPDGRKGEDFFEKIVQEFKDPAKYRFMFVGNEWGDFLNGIVHKYDLNPELFEVFERDVDCLYKDYPLLYGAVDAVLVTSKVDAGPVCILESLAKGIPVISTPTGLANELLIKEYDDKNLNKVIIFNDVKSFIKAMEEIEYNIDIVRDLEYKNKIRDLVVAPKNHYPLNEISDYINDYTWNSFCKRFENIYEDIYKSCEGKKFLEDFISNENQNQYLSWYSSQATNNLTNIYLENYQQIKPYAKNGIGVMHYQNALKGQPAVIVGAGPSLDKDIEILKKYKNKINIFACDAALPVLNKNGIIPDVVVVADPSDRQIQNFTGCNGKNFMTILPTIVHPMVFNEARKHDCVISWYNVADSNIELCKWIPKEIGYKGLIRPAVLTSGMVFQIAAYMGCSDITFVGHDLSWSDLNKGYASGISDVKVAYQKNHKMFNSPVFLFYDIENKIVTSDLSFITFVQWINSYLQEFNMEINNSTGSGILYGEKINQIDFETWCSKYNSDINPPTFPLLYKIYQSVKFGNDIPIMPTG